jgi:DNA polymerase elongation subunit (family B)
MTPKILMIDIETAPNVAYVWGLFNQNIGINQMVEAGRTLCFAAKWYGSKGLAFSSEWGDGREEMIQRAWELFDEADIVCHYNGTKFDVPTLNKEFVLEGMTPPAPFRQIDLLRTVRSQFRFTSNKLDYVAQQLGLGAKTAHTGFSLWTEVMHGEPKAQRLMERYNKQDVRLLENLYTEMLPWLNRTPNIGIYLADSSRSVCTKCGSGSITYRGFQINQGGKYRRFVCNDCGGWSRDQANLLDLDTRRHIARPTT